jgi:outer membrane protein assembly factor BamB
MYVCAEPDTVLAVDLAEGSVQWSYSEFGGTPLGLAVDNGSVYVVMELTNPDRPSVYALSRTGEQQWTFRPSGNLYTTLTHPTLAGETLYFAGDRGYSFALDTTSGKQRWRRDGIGSQPGVFGVPAVDGGTVYIRPSGRLYALDADSGETLWGTDRIGVGTVPATGAVTGDKILFKDSPEDTYREAVFAYDISSSEGPTRAWVTGNEVDPYGDMAAPTVNGNRAYVPLESWGLQAVSLADGSPVWSEPHSLPDAARETLLTDVVATENAVYYGAAGVGLHAVDPDTGETKYRIDGGPSGDIIDNLWRIQTAYVVTNGRVYTAGEQLQSWYEP